MTLIESHIAMLGLACGLISIWASFPWKLIFEEEFYQCVRDSWYQCKFFH